MLDWLNSAEPHKVLAARRASGWLAQHLPEVDALYGVPQTASHHPEVCTGAHIELCLAVAASLSDRFDVRFAVLNHDLGKALTPQEEWPRHVNHEHSGVKPLKHVCDRLQIPEATRKLALLVCEYHLHAHRFFELNDTSVVKFFDKTGLLEDEVLAEGFILACESDARGRLGKHDNPYGQGDFMRAARKAVQAHPYPAGVTMQDPQGNRIHATRAQAVREVRARLATSGTAPAC
jgi:tRNA nucleotidyltransferase (CCA-adding enzyme)